MKFSASEDRPLQPVLNRYPKQNISTKKTRSFNRKWYHLYPWLEYSVKKDCSFCYCCRVYGTEGEPTFTTVGYRNWPNALAKAKGFSKHQASESHKTAMLKWESYRKVQSGSELSIAKKLVPELDNIINDNRQYFKLLFKYVRWFSTSEVAMRARLECSNDPNELKVGKWKSFIRLQLDTNPTFRGLHLKVLGKRTVTDYTSKTVVNEMIEVIAEQTRNEILQEIKSNGFFSVLLDESKDTGKREELALAVRYIHGGEITERFLKLQQLHEFDAEAITTVAKSDIDNIIEKTAAHIVSLGADGASVMSGEFSGVAQRLTRTYSWLLYVHCTAHRLNLVVNDLIKSSTTSTDVMSTVKSLHTLMNHLKVRAVYAKEFAILYPKKQVKHLPQQIEIRWGCKFEAVDFLMNYYLVVIRTLANIVDAGPRSFDKKHVEQAAGFYAKLLSRKFIISLVTLHLYLELLYFLSKILQLEKVSWNEVRVEVVRCEKAVGKVTDNQILDRANALCTAVGISLDLSPIQQHLTRSSSSTASSSTNEIITSLNSRIQRTLEKEFTVRFNDENVKVLHALTAFDASRPNGYLDIDNIEVITEHFNQILGNLSDAGLRLEVDRAIQDVRDGLPVTGARYANLFMLINVTRTLAVTTATVERCFSTMNRVCTKVRSSVDPERLSDLVCISVNDDIAMKLDTNNLIDKWARKKSRRIMLL